MQLSSVFALEASIQRTITQPQTREPLPRSFLQGDLQPPPLVLQVSTRTRASQEGQPCVPTAVREMTKKVWFWSRTQTTRGHWNCLRCCTATNRSTAAQHSCKFRPKLFCGAFHGAFKRNCHQAHVKSGSHKRSHPKQSAVPYSLLLHIIDI